MALATLNATTVATKWATRAGAAGADYTNGVQNPSTDWATATAAAATVYGQAVQQAVSNGSFQKGVAAAGTSKWQSGAVNKGSTRYVPGVNAGKTNYVNGVTPYFNVLSNLTLPPRNVKGNNSARTDAVVTALMKQKASM
jgi:hypothetical protein